MIESFLFSSLNFNNIKLNFYFNAKTENVLQYQIMGWAHSLNLVSFSSSSPTTRALFAAIQAYSFSRFILCDELK